METRLRSRKRKAEVALTMLLKCYIARLYNELKITVSILKNIGFISFGRWNEQDQSSTRSQRDAFLQTIEMAVAAEEIGVDSAFFRIHHFSNSFSSPFPLLAAIGTRTTRIEIGTAVVDLRYENPFYMAETAGATDLICGERLQLGLGRGAPWSAIEGWSHFGYQPEAGQNETDMAIKRAEIFLDLLNGEKNIKLENPFPDDPSDYRMARVEPFSPSLKQRIWWASGSLSSAEWAAKHGLNLQSAGNSGPKTDKAMTEKNAMTEKKAIPEKKAGTSAKTGETQNGSAASSSTAGQTGKMVKFANQPDHIKHYLQAWKEAGHKRKPRVAIIRELVPLDNEAEKKQFHDVSAKLADLWPNHRKARTVFEGGYCGSSEEIVELMKKDEAVRLADTIMIPVANEIGLDFNLRLLEKIVKNIKPYLEDDRK